MLVKVVQPMVRTTMPYRSFWGIDFKIGFAASRQEAYEEEDDYMEDKLDYGDGQDDDI